MHDTPPNRRSQQKAATQHLILETAKQQFATLGFDKTTMRGIAKTAGIAVGTIFVHFPDKSALLAAALHEIIAQEAQTALDTAPQGATITTQLLHIARHLYSFYAQDPALSRMLLKETLFMQGEWGKAHEQQAQEFIIALTTLLQKAQAKGDIRADANCLTLAIGFFAHYLFVLLGGLREPTFNLETQLLLLEQLIGELIGAV